MNDRIREMKVVLGCLLVQYCEGLDVGRGVQMSVKILAIFQLKFGLFVSCQFKRLSIKLIINCKISLFIFDPQFA